MEKIILTSLILLYLINSKLYIMCFNKLLKAKYKQIIYNLAFLSLSIIVILKQLSKLVFFNNILLYITSSLMLFGICILILFCYENTLRKKLVILGLFFAATVFFDILSYIIGSVFLNIQIEQMTRLSFENVLITSLNMVFTLLLYFGILKIAPKTSDEVYKGSELIVLFTISIIIFIPSIIVSNNIESVESNLKIVVFIEFAIIFFVIMFSSLNFIKKNEEINNEKYRNQKLKKEIEHYNDIAEITEQLHQLRHDMSNHFSSVRSLIKQGEHDRAENYLDQICEQIVSAKDICLLDDKFLSIMLSEKFSKARKDGIEIRHMIVTNTFFYEFIEQLQEIDKTALFTNILDNAIEASIQTDEKLVDFSITAINNHIKIMCINSKPKEQLRTNRNGTYKSTKKGPGHGLGMTIIQETVWKYGGEIDYDVSETRFITTIDFYYRKE